MPRCHTGPRWALAQAGALDKRATIKVVFEAFAGEVLKKAFQNTFVGEVFQKAFHNNKATMK